MFVRSSSSSFQSQKRCHRETDETGDSASPSDRTPRLFQNASGKTLSAVGPDAERPGRVVKMTPRNSFWRRQFQTTDHTPLSDDPQARSLP
jgi:hypothetical protein